MNSNDQHGLAELSDKISRDRESAAGGVMSQRPIIGSDLAGTGSDLAGTAKISIY